MTSKQDRWLTLLEHDAQLKAEGRYDEVKERLRRQEEIRQEIAAANRVAEEPLV